MDLGSKYITCPKCKLVIDLYKISNADVCPRCAALLSSGVDLDKWEDKHSEDKPFELQTKKGSIWGSEEEREKLKEDIVLKGMKKLQHRGRNTLNTIIFLIIIIAVILCVVYRNQILLWLFSN